MDNSETGCCPPFNPKSWDEMKIVFNNRMFVNDKVFTLFHIPLNFGQVVTKNMEKIQKAGALASEPLMLSDSSLFNTDIYIEVHKKVPRAKNVFLSGTFLTKVFEGDYKNMGNWIKEMNTFVERKGKKAMKFYFFYTMCPKCAKHYGYNYTVILAQI